MSIITKSSIEQSVEFKRFALRHAPQKSAVRRAFVRALVSLLMHFFNLGYDAAVEDMKSGDAARLLGERGGLVGGPARANALTPERRKEIARTAANKRWHPKPEAANE
jgi:hypothetical protein